MLTSRAARFHLHGEVPTSEQSQPEFAALELIREMQSNIVETLDSWSGDPSLGSAHAPSVDLSAREIRSAWIRIGGHVVCALTTYAMSMPFVLYCCLQPASSPPTSVTCFLIIGICLPSAILACQSAAIDGIWIPAHTCIRSNALTRTESGITQVDVVSRCPELLAWSHGDGITAGIHPDGIDSSPIHRGSFGMY